MENRSFKTDAVIRLHSLRYSESRTYLVVAALVAGNMFLPQLCHLIPQGGLTLLPIYFFTLLGTCKYGMKAGILTALLSPLLNHLLFGMPPQEALPGILSKSVLLVVAAGFAVRYFRRVSLPILAAVVLGYQLIGTGVEYMQTGSFFMASQDFRLAIPGMLLQVFGVYGILRLMNKYGY
ncbi:MAG: ECF transporter S component [Bacteroides sp.]|nr:ECF transporter S component [Bacteroides sp.]